MNGKTKTEKGITLVALLITVIILLILASVAIDSIVDNGIISHAKNAVNEYNNKQEQENIFLNGYVNFLKNELGSGDSGECSHVSGTPTYTMNENNGGTHTVTTYCTKCNDLVSQTVENCDLVYAGPCYYIDKNEHEVQYRCSKCLCEFDTTYEEHSSSSYSEMGDGSHDVFCDVCSSTIRTEDCEIGEDGICVKCGYVDPNYSSCAHEHNSDMIFEANDSSYCVWSGICNKCGEEGMFSFEHRIMGSGADEYCEYGCEYPDDC